jgi:regulator of protease activity HflC (stomatin/prohibitin superfamily)
MTESKQASLNASSESAARSFNGYAMLVLMLLSMLWFGFAIASVVGGGPDADFPGLMGSIFAFFFVSIGFYMIQPNQGVALTLFGAYRGTDRKEGLRWIWPWFGKAKISLRANNLISEKIKVNDLRGNPIEIAAQVVWRVTDTAQALFDVDDYKAFVLAQIEAAVRTIGSRYPYDDIEHKEVTLRGNHDEVGGELRGVLMERLAVAGITVDECGFTHLAYAQEIAGAMVEMALQLLSEKDVVHLDDERKAAMVSNLMVVLCGERDTQPVVNTGSLYT